MTIERIERALRQGPLDEPTYVPGAFSRRRGAARTAALTLPAVIVAVGVMVLGAVGITALREGGPGGRAPSPDEVRAALIGTTWDTPEIPFTDWTDRLLERGFTVEDIAAFLEHDPFATAVRYRLVFGQDVLNVQASYDGSAPISLSQGDYGILGDGMLRFTEIVSGIGPADACSVTARVGVGERDLDLDIVELSQCDSVERLANVAFFGLAPYRRVQP